MVEKRKTKEKLKFEKVLAGDGVSIWYEVSSIKKGEHLGTVSDEHWNRWTWEQDQEVLMSRGCLTEVLEFMERLGGKK